jgi:predicted chitinase
LDKFLPQADFRTVWLPQDPPSPAQREAFWNHLRASIDAGYGLVLNWVSPASNPPIGIKGSKSPVGYGRYTIYHYVAAMGYDPYDRAVWIADSGFSPHGYWVSLEQCVVLMAPKGYVYAHAVPALPPVLPPPPVADNGEATLAEVMGNSVGRDRYTALLPAVEECLINCGCNTSARIAMWAAQIGHESGGLKYMEEIADGSAYEGRSDLGNTQPGDGRKFKGRGPIQVTGRHNYTNLSKWAHSNNLVPTPTFFVDHPHELASDKYGFMGVTWYWTTQRKLNEAADKRDVEGATRMINGGLNGISDRKARYSKAILMGDRLLAIADAKVVGDNNVDKPQPEADMSLFGQQFPSLSAYRTPGEGNIGNWTQIDRNKDAMIHQLFVEWNATQFGDPESVYRVFRSAAGQGADATPVFIAHADAVLKRVPQDMLARVMDSIEEKEPELIRAYLEIRGS